MVLSGLLAVLLALPALAQEQGSYNSACFLGLNDSDTPATLNSCDSPALLNVESNLQGTAAIKRKGFVKSADLTVATSAVTGSHSFIDSSGNRLDIVCQDRNCAKSTNGNAFSTFLTTAATGIVRWSFVDVGGVLYGANNKYDPIMAYDGTTRTSPPGMPLGSILELTGDRLAVGDISGQPNRVHLSSAGNYAAFTLGVNPEDSYFDDFGAPGDKVRGLKHLNGILYVFKTASITGCELGNQYTTRCSIVSPNIGTTDPGSITTAGSCLYFRAQDKNYWELCGGTLRQISAKIPNLVKSQSGGLGGGENSNTQTTQADWQAGTQFPTAGLFDASGLPGSIFPSSSAFADNTVAAFSSGTAFFQISTTDVTGISLSSTVYEDRWTNGTTAGRLGWNATDGAWSLSDGFIYGNTSSCDPMRNAINTSSVTLSSGAWQWDWKFSNSYAPTTRENCAINADGCFSYRFMNNAGGDYYEIYVNDASFGTPNPHSVSIRKNVSGVSTTLSAGSVSMVRDTEYSFKVDRSTDGRMFVSVNSVFIASTTADVSISSSVKAEIVATGPQVCALGVNLVNYFDDSYSYGYASSGTFLSRIYDTSFSTPIFGAFSSTHTVKSAEGQINYYVYASTSPNDDLWATRVASSDTLKITNGSKRYLRYQADLFTFISTKTPTVSAVGMVAASTGMFVSRCIEPGSSISSWGTLSVGQSFSGNGSLVYYATSAATCATLPATAPNTWQTSVTNNATLTIDTNTAVYIGWRSLLGSATDHAQVDVFTLAWNEGTPTQPSWAVYDSIKNAIYWTTTINNFAYSNRLLKYDRNLESWYPFDIKAQAPRVINNELYFGGASSGTWNKYGTVDADAGSSINGYWKTKDVGSVNPFLEKDFQTASLLTRNNGAGSLTATYTYSNAETGSYTVSLSTGSGIAYARSNFNLPKTSPQNFMNLSLGNNSTTPFEILGLGITWTTWPWNVTGP